MQQFDNLCGLRSLLQLFIDQHLILPRVVHARLACGDASTGNDHRLHVHQIARGRGRSLRKGGLCDTSCRRDDCLAGLLVDCNDRPGGECRYLKK